MTERAGQLCALGSRTGTCKGADDLHGPRPVWLGGGRKGLSAAEGIAAVLPGRLLPTPGTDGVPQAL